MFLFSRLEESREMQYDVRLECLPDVKIICHFADTNAQRSVVRAVYN